jgi:hypothetical protein
MALVKPVPEVCQSSGVATRFGTCSRAMEAWRSWTVGVFKVIDAPCWHLIRGLGKSRTFRNEVQSSFSVLYSYGVVSCSSCMPRLACRGTKYPCKYLPEGEEEVAPRRRDSASPSADNTVMSQSRAPDRPRAYSRGRHART